VPLIGIRPPSFKSVRIRSSAKNEQAMDHVQYAA
jgi:hypothetical protein